MYQSGKISGRVLDAAGKPVPNDSLGLMEMRPAGGMGLGFKADEKGEYSAVTRRPGPWVLTATPPPSWPPPGPPADSPGGQPLGWTETFYPGVTSVQLAAQFVVPPGGELRNMDIKLVAVPVRRIRGVVLDVSGHPVPKVSVTVVGHTRPSHHQDTRSDGTFDFASVVDGECRLSTTADKNGIKLRAVEWVRAKGDLQNVELRLTSPFSIQGKVVMEAPEGVRGTVEGCATGQVVLIPQDLALRRDGFIRRTSCGQNGRFEITAVRPGEYYGLAVAAGNPAEPRLGGFGEIRLDQNLINQSTHITVRSNEATLADLHLIAQ